MVNNTNKEQWNRFVVENSSPSSFLQSWEWGEFQEALGNKVYRLSSPLLSSDAFSPSSPWMGEDKGKGENRLAAQIIVKKLPLGRSYLEIPKGPIIENSKFKIQSSKVWEEFGGKLKEIAKQEKAVLARISPPYAIPLLPEERLGEVGGEGFQKPQILLRQTEPQDTILVDLSKSEAELMQNMHEKSRYNIRLAQKKGVKVRVATKDKSAFETFLKLLEETAKRDGITSWPRERFWKFRERFMNANFRMQNGEFPSPSLPRRGEGLRERSNRGPSDDVYPRAELLIGEYQNQILAAAIIMLFGDAGTYIYAASSTENRPANVPSLVLWEAIKLVKAKGKKWYDMWGIAPAAAGEDHPWAGITRFKTRYIKIGVTGKEVRNAGTLDLVLDKKFYTLFKLGKKLRL